MDFKAFEEYCKTQKIEYRLNEPMNLHTSFKIGGPADIFVSVFSKEQLANAILKLNELEIPYFILGKGSNLLVSDKGIEGVVINTLNLNDISVDGEYVTAQTGVSLASVCVTALENSLSGLEFAFGIPGAVGGALYMNAGAYGGEISQVVASAEYIYKDGSIKQIKAEDMCLGYRTSIFKDKEMVITSVTFKLTKGEKLQIKAAMDDFLLRRKTKQPLEYPSAGSTFKRPEGYFAGALIEKNNLKGASVGGAMVSPKHAGFIINYKNATCSDVWALMQKVSDTVYLNDGVKLCPEVIFVGRE
ncbi:MAG: UDP-N-acetylmuramate dehydrogenase [Clostridia bacterium]|nr:UDP-N-acetylmuramate dehydrogenase [Clostridia bacterium]